MTEERLREALLDASDHRACRNVWAARNGDGDADLSDYVETTRATGGDVALVAADGAADVYARWTGSGFEHLTLWPPWTVGGVDRTDRAGLESYLADKANLRAVYYEATPFADPDVLASTGGRGWP
jgi:hypothetical protein